MSGIWSGTSRTERPITFQISSLPFNFGKSSVPTKSSKLIKDLKKAGFTEVRGGGKGDHRKFDHPNVSRPAVLDGRDGEDAKP